MEILPEIKSSKFEYDKWWSKYGLDKHASDAEKDIWWGREEEYWMEGRFGLVGPHYFALTQAFIKHATGRKIRPTWRDIDDEIYGGYMYAKEKNHDMFITKRREVGLSLIFGGIMPVWTSFMYPGSTSLVTSADKTRLQKLYKDKTRVMFDNIDPYYRPNIVSTRQTGMLHMGDIDTKTGIVTGIDSQIITLDTVVKPDAMEAYRAMMIFVDEVMLHPHADVVLRSAQASVKSGFVKVAPIVLGGSAGESSAVGQKLASQLWRNAEDLRIFTLFLSGDRGVMEAPELDEKGQETGKILNFCPNGHSDTKAAREWIMQTRERLDRLEDKNYLNSFILQYPLEIHEVMQTGGAGNLPKHILDKVVARERILLVQKPPIERCTLVKKDEEIQIVPDAKGRVRILERPIEGHTYIAGNDPIPFNSTEIVKGSSQALAIKDYTLNRYVAWMEDRDSDPDMIVKEQILLQDLYFGAKSMLEINRGGVTKSKYKEYGRMDLLAGKPVTLGKGYMAGEGNVGFYKTSSDWIGSQLNFYLTEYLSKFTDEIYIPEILEQAKVFLAENTDLLDAISACELYSAWLVKKNQKEVTNNGKQVEFKLIPILKSGPGGVMQREWVKVPTFKKN